MPLYLPLWNMVYPELRLLDTTGARRTAIRESFRLAEPRVRRRWSTDLFWWADAVVVVALLAFFQAWSIQNFVIFMAAGLVVIYLLTPLAHLWSALSKRERFRRALRRQITELGRPVCVDCGYDLRGAHGARCVECGQPLPLMRFLVRTASPYGGVDEWRVTALADGHARELLEAHLRAQALSERRIIEARQIVTGEPIMCCGEVQRVESADG
ncbi:MAG: hypothetical protein D6744_18390 [Planctomycetota bacterium]|nr:MAG: hypothetical protein D6744_18390 [Planctomycetota bacterium]